MEIHTQSTQIQIHGGGFWKREKVIGCGSSAIVSLATTNYPTQPNSETNYLLPLPPLMAIKSSDVSLSRSLKKEMKIISELQGCPYIIQCYGDKLTYDDCETTYNLLLEYASGGNLAQRIKSSAGNVVGLPKDEVKRYTESILRGLMHIHECGYVHCDIKPHNILFCENNTAKIADFGVSKKANKPKKDNTFRLRGTLLYLAPESVALNEYEPPCDVWALGCLVLEMITGKPAWDCPPNTGLYNLLRMVTCGKSPTIPENVSKDARDFIEKCLVRDPKLRWTAKMLLTHPFIVTNTGDDQEIEVVQETDEAPATEEFSGHELGGKRRVIDEEKEWLSILSQHQHHNQRTA